MKTVCIDVPTNGFSCPVFVSVSACEISIRGFGKFFVHRQIVNGGSSDQWFVVSEKTTKCAIPCAPGRTRKDAVANARKFLKAQGKRKLQEAINRANEMFQMKGPGVYDGK